MATKLHSAVSSGSRHPIHQLEYPDAANRIAGTGEITGAAPKDYDVAKQNDDDSLWFLKDAGTLDWDQIMTGGVSITFEDDKDLFFGDSSDAAIQYDTTQTPDSWLFGVPATSNALILCLKANMGGDYAHGLQTNPTLFIHSATAAAGSTAEYISFTHDQTYGRISQGAGALALGAQTTSHTLNANGDLVCAKLEANGLIYADAGMLLATGQDISCVSSVYGAYTPGSTFQSPASAVLMTGSASNSIIVCERTDFTYNFAYPQQTNPTLCIHSANQSTTEYLALTHNQTNAEITVGAGGLFINSPLLGKVDAITATSETVSASVATIITEITTNGDVDLDNVSLANGVDGQIKIFAIVAVGNAGDSVKITPASMIGGTQITFAASPLGLGCTMVYDSGVGGWIVVGNNGGVIA